MKKCCLLALYASASGCLVAASGDHHKCACAAKERDFNINCADRDAMSQAFATLISNNCDEDCSSEVCHKQFLIVQSHHDHCLHDEVPESIEEGFHDFEEKCEHCEITRKFDPDLPPCPRPTCTGSTGDDAFLAMVDTGCDLDCTTSDCVDNYRILRVEHDACQDETLSEAAETGIHNFEESCEPYNCNVWNDEIQSSRQLVCLQETSSGYLIASAAAWTFAASAIMIYT